MNSRASTIRRMNVLLLWVTAVAIGCNGPGSPAALQRQNDQLKENVRDLRKTIAGQAEQIRTLQALGDKRLEMLFRVTEIKLGRYTAGVDLDDAEGDDGVRVYVSPRDDDGHTLKAAGAIRIQLFDLAAKPKDSLLGAFDFPAEGIGEHFYSGFLANHYKFDCRWKNAPAHDEITVRVVFTDYLTGKKFTAQKVVTIALPAKE